MCINVESTINVITSRTGVGNLGYENRSEAEGLIVHSIN